MSPGPTPAGLPSRVIQVTVLTSSSVATATNLIALADINLSTVGQSLRHEIM